MKAITVLEPWASLIACGAKKIETRSWETKYRGNIAIHAAKSSKVVDRPQLFGAIPAYLKLVTPKSSTYLRDDLDLGCVIAIADLVDCRQIIGTKAETINIENIGDVTLEHSKIILEGNPYEMEIDGVSEYDLGNYTPGRYAWILDNVQRVEPIPAKGQQRIWNLNVPALEVAAWHSEFPGGTQK